MNIRRNIVFSVTLLVLSGCGGQKSNYSNEELAIVIADMHISEMSLKRHAGELQDSLKSVFMERLVTIHGIAQEEIKDEVELLMEDPARQSDVYELVISRLQGLEKNSKEKKDPSKKN